MLVSSRETKRWIIPKGWPMSGRSGSASAAIEALEEAGVLGVISDEPIGQYFYAKRFSHGDEQLCRVEVFSLRVVRQRETWLEKDQRATQWFSAETAMELGLGPGIARPDRRIHPGLRRLGEKTRASRPNLPTAFGSKATLHM